MDSRLKTRFFAFLRRTELHTKTDMVYLVSQSGWLIFGQGVAFISSFVLALFFANYIEPSDYGIYKYVVSLATLASLTSLTGLGTSLARAASQNHAIRLLKLVRIRVALATIGSLGLLVVGIYYFLIENRLLASLCAIAAIWLPFYDTLSDYQFFLQGKKAFRVQTKLRIIQRLILAVAVIITIFLTQNIIIVTCVFFGTTAISHAIALRYTLRQYSVSDDSQTPYKSIVSYAKHLSVQNIFFIGAAQLDKIILFKILGPAQLATYYFALAIPQELAGLLGNVNSIAFPKLVNQHSREFKIALIKKIFFFTLILVVPVLGYILMAPYLFIWFFPVYMDAVFISQIFVGTILFIPVSLIWHHFYATDHKRALWFGTFFGPASLILSIILLAPQYGLVGAVLATYIRGFVDLFSGLYFFLYKTNG